MEKLELKELKYHELIDINGGAPSPKTSFWYDVVYYASYGVRSIGKAFEPTQESLATAHQNGA